MDTASDSTRLSRICTSIIVFYAHYFLLFKVIDVLEPPVWINPPTNHNVSVQENTLIGRLLYTVSATDPENQAVTYSMLPSPNEANFNLNPAGSMTYSIITIHFKLFTPFSFPEFPSNASPHLQPPN